MRFLPLDPLFDDAHIVTEEMQVFNVDKRLDLSMYDFIVPLCVYTASMYPVRCKNKIIKEESQKLETICLTLTAQPCVFCCCARLGERVFMQCLSGLHI